MTNFLLATQQDIITYIGIGFVYTCISHQFLIKRIDYANQFYTNRPYKLSKWYPLTFVSKIALYPLFFINSIIAFVVDNFTN